MVLVLPHESRSYVKGDPWASRPRGLTSHVAPHSLGPVLNGGRGMRGAGPCRRRTQTGRLSLKGDPWALRTRGLTSHVAPHSLSLPW